MSFTRKTKLTLLASSLLAVSLLSVGLGVGLNLKHTTTLEKIHTHNAPGANSEASNRNNSSFPYFTNPVFKNLVDTLGEDIYGNTPEAKLALNSYIDSTAQNANRSLKQIDVWLRFHDGIAIGKKSSPLSEIFEPSSRSSAFKDVAVAKKEVNKYLTENWLNFIASVDQFVYVGGYSNEDTFTAGFKSGHKKNSLVDLFDTQIQDVSFVDELANKVKVNHLLESNELVAFTKREKKLSTKIGTFSDDEIEYENATYYYLQYKNNNVIKLVVLTPSDPNKPGAKKKIGILPFVYRISDIKTDNNVQIDLEEFADFLHDAKEWEKKYASDEAKNRSKRLAEENEATSPEVENKEAETEFETRKKELFDKFELFKKLEVKKESQDGNESQSSRLESDTLSSSSLSPKPSSSLPPYFPSWPPFPSRPTRPSWSGSGFTNFGSLGIGGGMNNPKSSTNGPRDTMPIKPDMNGLGKEKLMNDDDSEPMWDEPVLPERPTSTFGWGGFSSFPGLTDRPRYGSSSFSPVNFPIHREETVSSASVSDLGKEKEKLSDESKVEMEIQPRAIRRDRGFADSLFGPGFDFGALLGGNSSGSGSRRRQPRQAENSTAVLKFFVKYGPVISYGVAYKKS